MPRRERPLESEETSLLRFAGDLRRLRGKAGTPTYRELGKRANYSAAALSEAAAGRRLPSLAVTLAYVGACDGDVGQWRARWQEIAAESAAEPRRRRAPYVGLRTYQMADSDIFFGREQTTANLLEMTGERRFSGVFGASGSGKSSVLRAGLAAAAPGPVLVLTPGPRPVEECALRLAGLLGKTAAAVKADLADPRNLHLLVRQAAPQRDLLMVVDQFEEVFTVSSPREREWLITALTAATAEPTSRLRVVIGVRADFYGHCARDPALVAALQGGHVLIGPMSTEELHRAITEPAARVGAAVEPALVARLIADVAGRQAALPLVSHALAETWARRTGADLTLAAYEAAGGVRHAIAQTAEAVYTDLLPEARQAARLLFQRLIAVGEHTEDTRRRVPRHEFGGHAALLDRLAAARLVTLDRDTVELAHEALIGSWPRLRDWLTEDRAALIAHRRLTSATEAWEAHGRDVDSLYRGVHLEQARELRDRLSARERAFVDAGIAAEAERTDLARTRVRRLRQSVAALVLLVLALAFALVLSI
ncbi:nSTAND1 domain-containing NTPase [Actinokineospora sp. NPDC004072]